MKDRNIIKMNDAKKSREFPEVVEILKEDIIVPETVLKKANLAFEAIKKEQSEERDAAQTQPQVLSVRKKFSWKKVSIIAAAAALTVGGVTAGASAYMKWSKGFSEGLHATEEQMKKAEETHLAAPVNKTAEVEGTKITAVQSIVDSHYAMISFKVDGYKEICPEGEQPVFEECKVWVDGYNPGEYDGYDIEKNFSVSGNVYNGFVMREDGMLVNAEDGTTMEEAVESGTYSHFLEDGSFEWRVILANEEAEGTFIDKPIRIELKNLGTFREQERFATDVEGTWGFDWTLTGSEERKEVELDAPLGDTGAKVTYAKLSPISLTLNYKCTDTTVRPPMFYGVKLKNGKCWPYLFMGPGKDSVIPDENGDFYTTFALNRIMDVNEVEALLFRKDLLANGESMEFKTLEESCYVVPLEAK